MRRGPRLCAACCSARRAPLSTVCLRGSRRSCRRGHSHPPDEDIQRHPVSMARHEAIIHTCRLISLATASSTAQQAVRCWQHSAAWDETLSTRVGDSQRSSLTLPAQLFSSRSITQAPLAFNQGAPRHVEAAYQYGACGGLTVHRAHVTRSSIAWREPTATQSIAITPNSSSHRPQTRSAQPTV